MAAAAPTFAAASVSERSEDGFSLVLGGPLYQVFRRTHLSDDGLGLVHRRIAVTVLAIWAPLVVLTALQGQLVGPGQTFFNDLGFQLRFLVTAPLLILAELVVHRRLRPLVLQFRERGLVWPDQLPRFEDAIGDARRLRNSVLAEALLLVAVYLIGGLFTLRRYEALGGGAWFASPESGRLSLAGLWLVFVSVPLVQFLLLRWYFRLFIWARFLWRMSRLDLDLNVTHPDKAAGLGFLSESLAAFLPIAAAHGVLFAGMMADRIFYAGAKLTDFQMEVFAGGVLLLVVFAGPLLAFIPLLARVKREELLEYGALGQTYARGFREKWIEGAAPADEPLIGTGDIQSLADLGNSYSNADQTRFVPISIRHLLAFFAAFLLPIVPLALTMMSVEQLVGKLVGLAF